MTDLGNHLSLTRRVVQLALGLLLFGTSMALMVGSGLGLTSWDVLHQGLSRVTGVSMGWIVVLTGVPVMALWIPLRQRPGIGTLANLLVVGPALDASLAVLPPVTSLPARIGYLAAGIALNGVATGMYIGAHFGAGPRDGLMTGIVRRFPRLSVRIVRTAIEITVLGIGFALGGTVGIGTLAFAVAIGPLVQLALTVFDRPAPAPCPPGGVAGEMS